MIAMSHGPITLRQRDVKAAIKAIEAANHEVARVEIERAYSRHPGAIRRSGAGGQ
jgi:hypothetical protein